MGNIGYYIAGLLHEHDCVIVPGLGGFVARPEPAHFSRNGKQVVPPGKSIVFNKNLSNNDGLLASSLMKEQGTSYKHAVQLIEQFVSDCRNDLNKYKRLELDGLGLFYFNAEQTLLFESSVSHSDWNSFGLAPVEAIKVEIPGNEVSEALKMRKDENKAPEKEMLYRKGEKRVKDSRTLSRISLLVSSLLLLVFLVFLTAKQLPLDGDLASLNPFASKENHYKAHSYNLKGLLFPETVIALKATETGDSAFSAGHGSRVFIIREEGVKKNTETKKANTTFTSSGLSFSGPFQVVVGCFAIKQNAYKLISQLKAEQIAAGIVGQNPRGLFVVSVAGCTSESLARQKLDKIKDKFPTAWVMVK